LSYEGSRRLLKQKGFQIVKDEVFSCANGRFFDKYFNKVHININYIELYSLIEYASHGNAVTCRCPENRTIATCFCSRKGTFFSEAGSVAYSDFPVTEVTTMDCESGMA
jgi:hypothetical protein